SRIARRRRRSNSAAVPCGRMHAVYTTADDLSITYAILNKRKSMRLMAPEMENRKVIIVGGGAGGLLAFSKRL
ncbi:MAG: hypothetical protein ABSA52_23340, partial [Candidatus Binatia bacterium]